MPKNKAGRNKLNNKLNEYDYQFVRCYIERSLDDFSTIDRIIIPGYGAHSLQARRVKSLINKLHDFRECVEQEEKEDDAIWTNPLSECGIGEEK